MLLAGFEGWIAKVAILEARKRSDDRCVQVMGRKAVKNDTFVDQVVHNAPGSRSEESPEGMDKRSQARQLSRDLRGLLA